MINLRTIFAATGLGLFSALFLISPSPARADAPGLKVAPLQYEDVLTPGRVKTGFVEVANPGDSLITIETSVKGFRQTGTDGRLEFFDNPDLAAGIKVDLASFDLGPREAVRVAFNVDPGKLPGGGIYAAIFFRTLPPPQSSGSSYVTESANIGTLLILTNGPAGPRQGVITPRIPFWQFGSGLAGALDYKNTDPSAHPVAFRPNLTVSVLPWAAAPKLDTALVMPGSVRHFQIARPGGYFGFLPLTITDTDSHRAVTRWIFACTGWCQWAVIVLLIVIILLLPARVLTIFKRHPKAATKRTLDGLSPKK